MSNLVVIAFDDMHQARELRATLKQMEQLHEIRIDDAAIVVKDENGEVQIQDEIGQKLTWGMLGGGALGVLLLFAFPLATIAVGAGAVAAMGKLAEKGIDTQFVTKLTDSLAPGSSALFLLVREANREAVTAALRPFKGTVLQSSLEPATEEALKQALSDFQ